IVLSPDHTQHIGGRLAGRDRQRRQVLLFPSQTGLYITCLLGHFFSPAAAFQGYRRFETARRWVVAIKRSAYYFCNSSIFYPVTCCCSRSASRVVGPSGSRRSRISSGQRLRERRLAMA